MNPTTKTVAISVAALLTAVSLSACVTTATTDSLRDRQREEYENTLKLWLSAEEGEKAAACEALAGDLDHQRWTAQPDVLDPPVSHDAFDEEFLQGRC